MKKMILMAAFVLTTSLTFSQPTNSDEQSMRSIAATMEIEWNNKNGENFSSVFAGTHDYIVVNGMYFPQMTRKQNADAHQHLFDGIYKTRDIKLNVDKIVTIRADLVMLYILGASYEKGTGAPKDPGVIMSVLVEKQKEGWRIIAFHNHGIDPEELKQSSPMPLEVMYASWYKK